MTMGGMSDICNVDGWMRDGDDGDGDDCMRDKGPG